MTDKQKAIIRYHESGIEKEEQSPLERLRFFCQLAMSGDDWVDAGHFFDSLALQVRDKVDVGPWSAGTTTDGRTYLESGDFTHDVRLYVDGDFAWPGDKLSYAQGVARQLNADSNLAVTWDESMSRILAVTRQDSDGQIISVIAVAPPAVTPISEPPPEFRYIAKGDLRLINGQWMTCTDPEIGRWQGSGPPVSAEPVALPQCPFPCGWSGLHKIAVQDAAYLAKVQWPEDEEGVSVPRATAMRSMDYLIQVCRAMLNAAPVAARPDLTQQTLDDVKAGIPARDAEIEALRAQQPVSGADGLVALEGRLLKVAETVVQKWQNQERMPPLAWDFRGFLVDGMRAALAQQDADNNDELFYKLGCFIDYATGGRLSKLNWSLATLKQSHDENLEALIAERMQEAKEDEQDATLHAEVLDMVRMLEANEWADHCGKSELGQRLEWAITALQNRLQNIPEIIPESAQQDADKVDAERYRFVSNAWLVLGGGGEKFGWPIAPLSKEEWDKYIDAARKEQE